MPVNAPLPAPEATSRSPTSRRAEVTGPLTVTRMETRPETLSPARGFHVAPSREYSTWPMVGLAWSFRTASRAFGSPAPRYSWPSTGFRRPRFVGSLACFFARATIWSAVISGCTWRSVAITAAARGAACDVPYRLP